MVLLVICVAVLSGCRPAAVTIGTPTASSDERALTVSATVALPTPTDLGSPTATPTNLTPTPSVTVAPPSRGDAVPHVTPTPVVAPGSPPLTPVPPSPTPMPSPIRALASPAAPIDTPESIPGPPSPPAPIPAPPSTPEIGPIPPSPTAHEPPPEAPAVRQTTITINTADYQSALVPTTPDDAVYPYPRLQHELVGPPAPKAYRAVVLENHYLQLTILPELGGRIYRWVDKASGKNLFYENPIISPTMWGNRGWWLAAGGMEWALPVDEHGLSEATPWNYDLFRGPDAIGVTVSDVEERSGLVAEITITVDATHSFFTLTPKITNPGRTPLNYKFWINGMFALGAHQIGPGLRFVLPGNQVTVHSTGDASLPRAHEPMDWPVFKGLDYSKYETWQSYLGIFAAPAAQDSFMGAYNRRTNLGVVRIFPHRLVRGAKIFAPGDLDPELWTVDGSSYFELWGGLAPTFWDAVTLEPGQHVTWQEQWYAIGDTGGFNFANPDAALNLGTTSDTVQVAAASTRSLNARLILWQGENPHVATDWPIRLAPERPFRGNYRPEQGATGPWGLSLVDEDGRTVAATGRSGDSGVGNTTVP
jgi:hypothetical protein